VVLQKIEIRKTGGCAVEQKSTQTQISAEDTYQFPLTILFTFRQLQDIFKNLHDASPLMLRNNDGGTGTHGTSCDGGVCQIDK